MASVRLLGRARQWFASLSGAGRALLLVAIVALSAVAVAALVTATSAPASVGEPTAQAEGDAGVESAVATASPDTAASAQASVAVCPVSSQTAPAATAKKPVAATKASAGPADTSRPPAKQPSGGDPRLTEALRKKVALELVAAEKNAKEEADARYPVSADAEDDEAAQKNTELQGSLLEQYTNAIREKYRLSYDQIIEILIIDVPAYE